MELILEYLANRLKEGDCICHLGNLEMQTQHQDCLPTNQVFDGSDRLYTCIQRVLNQYLEIEEKHWAECGYPMNHIYIDLNILKDALKPCK